jgi:hypothetical protein
LIKYTIDQRDVDIIKSAALQSKGDEAIGVPLPYASLSAIKTFYARYGTTANGYQQYTNPSIFYAGYVKILDSEEFICVIIRSNSGIVIAGFSPGIEFGGDMLSLMRKKEFYDTAVAAFKSGA